MINYSISWNSGSVQPAAPKPLDPLQEGIQAHRRGDLDQAMGHYVQALRNRPTRAIAHYNLGVALIDAGLGLTSLPFLTHATLLRPDSLIFRYARLFALIHAGRLEQARQLIDDSTQRGLPPETLDYWRNWVANCAAGRNPAELNLAAPSLADAVNELPDRAPALPTISAAQPGLQQPFAQAIEDYQAGRLQKLIDGLEPLLIDFPEWGEGHHLRGLGLMGLQRFEQAVASLQRASELLPGRAEIRDHLGVACVRLGDDEGVRRAFEQALSLNPLRAETWNNAADSALSRGRFDEAFQYGLQAVRLKPDLRESSYCLLQAAYRLDALALENDSAEPIQTDRGSALTSAIKTLKTGVERPEQALALAPLLAQIGQYQAAIDILEQSLARFAQHPPMLLGELMMNQRHLCDWRHWSERLSVLSGQVKMNQEAVISPFSALTIPGLTPDDLLKVARQQAASYGIWMDRASELRPAPLKSPDSRLRIGYLSADFQEHATAYLTAGLFERHDRERFEIFAYSSDPDDGGPMRQRLRQAFDHFIDIRSLSHLAAAQRIRDDGIDILIDLKGYTRNARIEILALRPSPLQVTWLGFPGGLGAPFIDYLIADPVVAPSEQAIHYDEAIAYLPDVYAPVDANRQIAVTPTRAEAGLPATGFVFCCFNDPYKITPEVFDRWCALLKAVPHAVLWLYAKSDEVMDNLRREAAIRDVASARLIFARKKPQPEHLARLALADLFLDTQPVNAHTTASDALWMGVPVLTCLGETFAARVAASLLNAVGLPELIATDLDDYQARALRLASQPQELAVIKQRLADAHGSAAFFDTTRFTRNLEALYQRIWDRHTQGLPPAPLAPIQAICPPKYLAGRSADT